MFLSFLMVLIACTSAISQRDTLFLSLDQAIRLARENSVDALIASNKLKNANWNYQSWRADQRPLLSLSGTVPSFDRTIEAITLPDGTDVFINRSLANSNLNLSLSQEIGPTGGRIFAGSGLQRIDLFGDSSTTTSYLGSPFFVGLQQPILRYNAWKWRRQIEPLILMEADRIYLEDLEFVSINVVNLFFNQLLSEINYQISSMNLNNNDSIYKISQGRYNLGKIAESELLQVELSLLNARVAQVQAENDIANSSASLKRFLQLPEDRPVALIPPHQVPELKVDPQDALAKANLLRSDPLRFERQEIEANQSVAAAKGNTGFSADLFATYGLNSTASSLGDAYADPTSFQNVGLSLDIPILDWGKAKATREIAIANRELVLSQIERSVMDFEQEVLLRVQQFNLQADQVAIAAKADTVSRKRFEVAKARYLIGKTDITDLTIASAEEDQARRAYILALQSYWNDYYSIRRLTLYDYESDRRLAP